MAISWEQICQWFCHDCVLDKRVAEWHVLLHKCIKTISIQCKSVDKNANFVCSLWSSGVTGLLTWPSARRNTGKKHEQRFYPCKPAAAEQSSDSGLPHLQCPRQHRLFRFHRSGEIQQRFVWSELTNVLYVQWLNRYLIRTLNTFSVHSRFEISEKQWKGWINQFR